MRKALILEINGLINGLRTKNFEGVAKIEEDYNSMLFTLRSLIVSVQNKYFVIVLLNRQSL